MNFIFYRFPKTIFFNIFKLRANKFKNLCENKKVYNNVLNRKVYGDALFITYSVSILGLFKSDEETPENKLITTIKRSILCIQREQYDKAEQMLHLALRMSQDLQSKDGITYVYDIMANLAMEREQYKKAERLFAEVMRRLLGDGLSEENTKILHISSKLAHIAQLQGDIEKAKTGFVWTLSKIEECRKKMPDDIDVKELWGLTTNCYSIILVDCLEKREVHLLDNDIVLPALYLDPRLRRILLQTPNNMIRARKFLNFSKKESDDVSSNVLNNQIDLITNYDVNESESNFTLIGTFLNLIEVVSNDEESDEEEDELRKAIAEIIDYNPKPLDINMDIMRFWEEKKYSHPYLYKLANVINSVPATQVCVKIVNGP
ncbi:mitochondrial, Tetratricopeptide repeat protein 19 like protein [Lucilia cuprina]|nr:mitochondrial, Tetratricopeptide repeat protein 19 like protein [Lucilia cuprina]